MPENSSRVSNESYLFSSVFIIFGGIILYSFLIGIISPVFNGFLFFLTFTSCAILFYLQSTKRKTRIFFMVLMTVGFVVASLEFITLLHYKVFILNDKKLPRYSHNRTTYWVEDSNLGYRPLPSRVINARKIINGRAIYDVSYTFNSNGWRSTKSSTKGDCSFLFFGGSSIFGEGLHDAQSLPSQFSRKLNYNQTVLNFGFHGYGPHHMLRILEIGIPKKLINGKVSAIFYRLSAEDMFNISGYKEPYFMGPKYIVSGNSVQYAGNLGGIGGMFNSWPEFRTGIVALFRNSRLISLLYRDQGMSNGQYIDRNTDLLVKILSKVKQIAREEYQSRLIVIGEKNTLPTTEILLSELSNSDMLFVDIGELLLQEEYDNYLILDDTNLNGRANSEIAASLTNRFGEC